MSRVFAGAEAALDGALLPDRVAGAAAISDKSERRERIGKRVIVLCAL